MTTSVGMPHGSKAFHRRKAMPLCVLYEQFLTLARFESNEEALFMRDRTALLAVFLSNRPVLRPSAEILCGALCFHLNSNSCPSFSCKKHK